MRVGRHGPPATGGGRRFGGPRGSGGISKGGRGCISLAFRVQPRMLPFLGKEICDPDAIGRDESNDGQPLRSSFSWNHLFGWVRGKQFSQGQREKKKLEPLDNKLDYVQITSVAHSPNKIDHYFIIVLGKFTRSKQ